MKTTNDFYLVFASDVNYWHAKCRALAFSEYCKDDEESFEKWKSDGSRFMQKSFLEDGTLPLLNDGRPELIEWLTGTMSIGFANKWGNYNRLLKSIQFLRSMRDEFEKRMKKPYQNENPKIDLFQCCLVSIRSALYEAEEELENRMEIDDNYEYNEQDNTENQDIL